MQKYQSRVIVGSLNEEYYRKPGFQAVGYPV